MYEALGHGGRENVEISSTECARDLGVIVSSDLKWTVQVKSACARANQVLGILKRTFSSREVGLWLRLYISLVRPHLDFGVQVWCPSKKADVSALKKVQQRATKILLLLRGLSYEERLLRLGLTKLSERRVRGDMIEVFKIVNGLEEVEFKRDLVT